MIDVIFEGSDFVNFNDIKIEINRTIEELNDEVATRESCCFSFFFKSFFSEQTAIKKIKREKLMDLAEAKDPHELFQRADKYRNSADILSGKFSRTKK